MQGLGSVSEDTAWDVVALSSWFVPSHWAALLLLLPGTIWAKWSTSYSWPVSDLHPLVFQDKFLPRRLMPWCQEDDCIWCCGIQCFLWKIFHCVVSNIFTGGKSSHPPCTSLSDYLTGSSYVMWNCVLCLSVGATMFKWSLERSWTLLLVCTVFTQLQRPYSLCPT